MSFIGRKEEKKKIIESLNQGGNIILGGKFGVGRTTLAVEIANRLADVKKFVFVDFGQTPGKMSR
jgi:DNA replication protein DnaC